MSKFKIEVELDELFCNDEARPTDALEDIIVDRIVSKLSEKTEKAVAAKVIERADAIITEHTRKALEGMADGLFDKQIEVTDSWGNKKFSGTLREKVQDIFEHYLTEMVDKNGSTSSYGGIFTRTEWFAKKILEKEMEKFTKETVETIKRAVKEKLTGDLQAAVGAEIVNSIGVKNVIDRLKLPEK